MLGFIAVVGRSCREVLKSMSTQPLKQCFQTLRGKYLGDIWNLLF